MGIQQIVALVVFVGVYALFASRLVHRAAAALTGAVVLAVAWGAGNVVSSIVPDVLLVTAGLMVLAGFVKRSGLASWLALKAAKAGRGRPARILLLTGVMAYLAAAVLGPSAAVVLFVPVSLLLAVELDVPALPFVTVLSWCALLGGATTLTAHPSNLWVGAGLGIDAQAWVTALAPFTLASLALTLVAGVLVFSRMLRVTNERRARVLEYDEARSLQDRPLLVKTLTVLILVIAGLMLTPWLALSPSVVVVGGATILLLWDGRGAVDRSLSELDGGTLLFYGGLFAVVGALAASGLSALVAGWLPAQPLTLLWGTAVLGGFIDHGAVAGALVPTMKAWAAASAPVWPFVVLGSNLGAGVTAWGAVSSATAFGLADQGSRRLSRREFIIYGLLFAVLNLALVSALVLLLVR